jgi:hypothetical protein
VVRVNSVTARRSIREEGDMSVGLPFWAGRPVRWIALSDKTAGYTELGADLVPRHQEGVATGRQ